MNTPLWGVPPMSRRPLRQMDALDDLLTSIGSPSAAFALTAGALHGFDTCELRPPFHVLVPYERTPRRPDHRIHRTRWYDQRHITAVDDIPVTSPTLTLIDVAAVTTAKRMTVILDGALRDGMTSENYLHQLIGERRRQGRAGPQALLRVIEGAEVVRGGHSWLERRFLELCAEVRLPRPLTQQVLARRQGRLVRVDCRFPDTPVVVELLGYRWHRSQDDLDRDTRRANALLLAGSVVLQFTYRQVTEDPAHVIAQVAAAVRGTSPLPRPHL